MYGIVQILDMEEITSTIHVVVPDRVHRVAKIRAAERRLTLKQYVIALILEDVTHEQQVAEAPENA